MPTTWSRRSNSTSTPLHLTSSSKSLRYRAQHYIARDVPRRPVDPCCTVRRGAPGRALLQAPTGPGETVSSHEQPQQAKERLFGADGIDIDFRRITTQYWETFLPESGDVPTVENERGRLLQWFAGEGRWRCTESLAYRKLVTRSNARLMLQSLNRFTTHIGYRGLLILFDEAAEMSYSMMRKSNLKQAHNNLLHLIKGIDETEGLFLIHATTPDFYIDERHGSTICGALAQRIGKTRRSPTASSWTASGILTKLNRHRATTYGLIRSIYITAYPEFAEVVPSEAELQDYARKLLEAHPEFSREEWRILVQWNGGGAR